MLGYGTLNRKRNSSLKKAESRKQLVADNASHTKVAAMKLATGAHGLNFILSSRFVSIALYVLLTASPPTPAAANLFRGGTRCDLDYIVIEKFICSR
jgi:hypothetical protein